MIVKIIYWTLLYFLIRNILRLVKITFFSTKTKVKPNLKKKAQNTADKGSVFEAEYTVLKKDRP